MVDPLISKGNGQQAARTTSAESTRAATDLLGFKRFIITYSS